MMIMIMMIITANDGDNNHKENSRVGLRTTILATTTTTNEIHVISIKCPYFSIDIIVGDPMAQRCQGKIRNHGIGENNEVDKKIMTK